MYTEVFRGENPEQWFVRIMGDNGEKVMLSEAYVSKFNAERAADRLGWEVRIPEEEEKT